MSATLEAALANVTRAISGDPGCVAAYLNRALILLELGRPQAALGDYDRAIALDEKSADAHYGRGCVLHGQGDWMAARRSYDLAESSGLRSAALYLARGAVLVRLRDLDAALASFDCAIAVDRASPEAHYNRGVVLARLGDPHGALRSYSQAISIKPDFFQAYLNRGVVLAELARPVEALGSFEHALRLRPDFAEAHFGRALVLLRLGEYERGWEAYEWRWKNKSGTTCREKRDFPRPLWLGSAPIAGKTILLHAEQGFGDTLQFCRYARLVAELGATVLLEVPAALVSLLKSLPGPSRVLTRGEPLPEFDVHCPLMSLPLAFRTTLERIPAVVPYLRADAAKVDQWERRLGVRDKLRVGLVWSGRPLGDNTGLRPTFNARRDVPMAALATLAHPRVQYYSLQTGPAAAQLAELGGPMGSDPPVDCGKDLADFADTAALLAHLDLVITVDTATAHLAGALGKPVWIMNRFDTCWRWLTDRSDSPWYPSATLYRQSRRGFWDDVLVRIRADLESTVANHDNVTIARSGNP